MLSKLNIWAKLAIILVLVAFGAWACQATQAAPPAAEEAQPAAPVAEPEVIVVTATPDPNAAPAAPAASEPVSFAEKMDNRLAEITISDEAQACLDCHLDETPKMIDQRANRRDSIWRSYQARPIFGRQSTEANGLSDVLQDTSWELSRGLANRRARESD